MRHRSGPDTILFGVTMALVTIGVVTVFSASYPMAAARAASASRYNAAAADSAQDPRLAAAAVKASTASLQQTLMHRQLQWALVGLLALVGTMTMPRTWLTSERTVQVALAVAGVLLLLAFTRFGSTHGREARRWIHVGSFTLQPSEFAKLALCLFLAWRLGRVRTNVNDSRHLVPALIVTVVLLALVLLEPHLGGMLVLAGTAGCVLFAAGVEPRRLALLGLLGAMVVTASVLLMPYQRLRLIAWLNPAAYADDIGYQAVHCGTALARGGLAGRGLGRSIEKFLYLPECHTDSILAVLGEEQGFLGTVTVLALFLTLAWRGLLIAAGCAEPSHRLLATGLTAGIFLQAVLNFGVTTGLLPQTGVGMPFLTYGGSSLVFCLTSVGVLLNLSRRGPAPAPAGDPRFRPTAGHPRVTP
jgi:cell division protein FtsW